MHDLLQAIILAIKNLSKTPGMPYLCNYHGPKYRHIMDVVLDFYKAGSCTLTDAVTLISLIEEIQDCHENNILRFSSLLTVASKSLENDGLEGLSICFRSQTAVVDQIVSAPFWKQGEMIGELPFDEKYKLRLAELVEARLVEEGRF